MKKCLCLLLLFCLLFCMPGCTRQEAPIENPVTFHYRQNTIAYHTANGVLGSEQREAGAKDPDYVRLLDLYLMGPVSQTLHRTFPQGSKAVSFEILNNTAVIVVNDAFAKLTGMDLTLACASLTLTVCDMTGVETVLLSAENTMLGNSYTVTMSRSTILLMDDSTIAVDPA